MLGARRKFASLTCAALALRQALGLPLARKGGNGLGMPPDAPDIPDTASAIGSAAFPTSARHMYRVETQWALECGPFSGS